MKLSKFNFTYFKILERCWVDKREKNSGGIQAFGTKRKGRAY